jgi:HK97 family phage prohead protease
MISHANRAKILDVHETRACARPFEYRQDGPSGKIVVEGYAATYEPYEVYGGPDKGGWTEQIERHAFDVTLATRPDLVLLVNHEGYPLARTTTDTLQVSRDHRGLRVRALLDPGDPDVQRLMPKLQPQANGKSNMDEMSFGFRVKDQVWDNSYTHRTITELSLQKGDVSIVNYGANPTTSVMISDAVDALAALSREDSLELRKIDPARLGAALTNLAECRADDGKSKKPYGDVKYADPGYKDGVKRYPIDTEAHARAAWSYINMPKNQSGYSSEQLASVKGRIKAALKRFGVDVSEDKKSVPYSAPTAPGFSRADMPHMMPLGPGDPSAVPYDKEDDDDEEDDIEGCDEEAFDCPGNDMITVGPLAAALRATITEAYKLATDNDESTVTLLAKAAELLDRAAHDTESDIDFALRQVRDAAQPRGLRSLGEALAELTGVSQPPTWRAAS